MTSAANSNMENIGEIPIINLTESRANPRKTFGDMKDLEDSIRVQGVLVPILIREVDGRPEIICGARRFRAAKAMGLHSIPAVMVHNCSDELVAEIQIIENAQRSDVHPMEEAEAYEKLAQRLSREFPSDPEAEVARRVGKSRSHVLKRLVLCDLPPWSRGDYKTGKITQEVAIAIARIPNKALRDQASRTIIQNCHGETTESHLEWIRDKFMLDLSVAGFSKSDALLVKGAPACTVCPKRSGANQDLFGDVGKDDLCSDSVCFKKKSDADWILRTKAAKEKGVRVLTKADAEEMFKYSETPRSNELLDPSEKNWALGDKTYRQILKSDPPAPVIVRSPRGQVIELWDRKEIDAKLKAIAPKGVEGSRDRKRKDAERLVRQKAKVEKRAIALATEKLLDGAFHSERSGDDFLRSVIVVMCQGHRVDQAKRTQIKKRVATSTSAGLMSLFLATWLSMSGDWEGPTIVQRLAESMGLDMKGLRKMASDEVKK